LYYHVSQAKHLWLFIPALRQKGSEIEKSLRKNPNRDFDSGFLKSYPADAVQADHPFPFSHGWMTVTTASDFQ
jgi:hypothetical protein